MQKHPIMYNPYLQFSKYGLLKSLNEVLTAFKLPHQRKETLIIPTLHYPLFLYLLQHQCYRQQICKDADMTMCEFHLL